MSLTADDRHEIQEVIALHGHLCDAAAYERFAEVFTSDLEVDVSAMGRNPLPAGDASRPRLDAYVAAARRIGPGHTLGLHATNIIVRADGDGAQAWSKAIAVSQDGTVSSFTYEDRLVQTRQGWRIRHRKVSPRREPGRGPAPQFRPGEDRDAPRRRAALKFPW